MIYREPSFENGIYTPGAGVADVAEIISAAQYLDGQSMVMPEDDGYGNPDDPSKMLGVRTQVDELYNVAESLSRELEESGQTGSPVYLEGTLAELLPNILGRIQGQTAEAVREIPKELVEQTLGHITLAPMTDVTSKKNEPQTDESERQVLSEDVILNPKTINLETGEEEFDSKTYAGMVVAYMKSPTGRQRVRENAELEVEPLDLSSLYAAHPELDESFTGTESAPESTSTKAYDVSAAVHGSEQTGVYTGEPTLGVSGGTIHHISHLKSVPSHYESDEAAA